MVKATPRKLAKDTILQAIFEVRFAAKKPFAGDLLVGMLMDKLGELFTSSNRLPAGELPASMLEANPQLAYSPVQQLSGEGVLAQVGHRMASISVLAPYPGWSFFKPKILQFLAALRATNLVETPERFSIKYINVIPAEPEQSTLLAFRVQVKAPKFPFDAKGFQLRMESDIENQRAILLLRASATATVGKDGKVLAERKGTALDVDVINQVDAARIFDASEALVDAIHDAEKIAYFGILTEETIESLGPEW